jgi:hypothetical protein
MSKPLLETQMKYIEQIYGQGIDGLERRILARREGKMFYFRAFGRDCCLTSQGVIMDGQPDTDWAGVLVSIYALNASEEDVRLYPLHSFKEIGGTIAQNRASWVTVAQEELAKTILDIQRYKDQIIKVFDGHDNQGREGARGDFSFTLYPLPKVPLFYNFYLPDEEFAASVTGLIASNARAFLPLDTVGDVVFVTVKTVLEMVQTLKQD